MIGHSTCNSILKRTKLGPDYDLHAGFMCAGGERGKDACEVGVSSVLDLGFIVWVIMNGIMND